MIGLPIIIPYRSVGVEAFFAGFPAAPGTLVDAVFVAFDYDNPAFAPVFPAFDAGTTGGGF